VVVLDAEPGHETKAAADAISRVGCSALASVEAGSHRAGASSASRARVIP
jgi:hypothetical protein